MSNFNKCTNTALVSLWTNVVLFLVISLLSACENIDYSELEEEGDTKVEQTSLKIKTRANSAEDGEVSYPVNVYVMNSSGTCVDYSQLDSSTDELKFSLEEGTYTVYAIAGATEDCYELPSKDNATSNSNVVLSDNMEHGDLMTASDNVVLTKGETNTLTLSMTRRVAMIESINLTGLPSDATAVDVTLSPLAKYIRLNGSNSEETTSKTISLSLNSTTGTWTNRSGIFITESTSNISIKVSINISGTKASYTSNYKGKVEANHKLTINGTYSDNNVSLQGVLTGVVWDDPITINFELGEDANSDSDSHTQDDTNGNNDSDNDDSDTTQTGNAPSVGTSYDNCVVIKSTTSGSSTIVTLMSIDEHGKLSYSKSQKGKDNEKFQAEIAACIESTMTFFEDDNLRLPTIEELEYVYNNRETINAYIEDIDMGASLIELKAGGWYCGYYYKADDGYIYVYTLDGQIDDEPNPNRTTYKVRGFKTLTFTN